MKITDVAFKLNNLETFIYDFQYENKTISEYIHGTIVEFIETDIHGVPIIVKIKQVSNLKDFVEKKDVILIDRIFRVMQLRPFINYKT